MLVLPKINNTNINYKHQQLLEETLRFLGDFKDEEIIEIHKCEHLKNGDIIFSIKDANETTFKFYNFDVDDDLELMTRFRKNYHITMQKRNSDIEYKYNFFNYNEGNEDKRLNLMEISVLLNNKRKIIFKLTEIFSNEFIIEEEEKRYLFYYSEDIGLELIENLERLIEILKNIENINIENILKYFPKLNKIKQCMVYEKDNRVAAVSLENGNITGYEINNGLETIKVNVNGTITRSIIYNNKLMEERPVSVENEKFKNECKRLLKEI